MYPSVIGQHLVDSQKIAVQYVGKSRPIVDRYIGQDFSPSV